MTTEEERRAILAKAIARETRRGRRVESQSEFQAVLVAGRRVNHTLHAVLTIFLCFLWAPVWFLVALLGGEKRRVITVDEYGKVTQH